MDEKSWNDCKTAFRSARYILFAPVFLILTISHISRAMRWKILMQPMGYNPKLINTFFAVMIGYLANLAFPRLGEVLKCTLLAKYEKVPADKLVGTILIERAVDVLSLLLIFFIAFLSQASIISEFAKQTFSKYFLKSSTEEVTLKVGTLIAVGIILFFAGKYVMKKYGHIVFIEKIRTVVIGVKTGLSSVREMQNKWVFIFHSVLIWSCYVVGTYIGFFAIKETAGLPFLAAFPVLAFASIGMIVTPGGIGTYPLLIMEVMKLYDIAEPFGFANGNLQWVAQAIIIVAVGFVSLLLIPSFNKVKNKPPVAVK